MEQQELTNKMFVLACEENNVELARNLIVKEKINISEYDNNHEMTLLMEACKNNYTEIVELLLSYKKNEIDINKKNTQGSTALMFASENGNAKIVKLLIENGANPDLQNNSGLTALMLACDNLKNEVIKLLIENNANINLEDKNSNTALMIACEKNDIETVELLINKNVEINHKNKTLNTPILLATTNNYYEVVEILARNGADVNSTDINGVSPLIQASISGYDEIVKTLINHNVNVNYCINENQTALSLAIARNYNKIAELLIKSPIDITKETRSFITACENGNYEIINLLIEKGIDINATDSVGINALSISCAHGYEKIVELLLTNKNINIDTREECLPFKLACDNARIRMMKLLLERLNINLDNKENKESLRNFFKEIVKSPLVISNNNKARIINLIDLTIQKLNLSLLNSVKENDTGYVRNILNTNFSNIDINYHDSKGNTFLTAALANNNYSLAFEIIEKGINVNYKSNDKALAKLINKETVGGTDNMKAILQKIIKLAYNSNEKNIEICKKNNSKEIKSLIDNNKLDIDYINKEDKSAFMILCENENLECLKYMFASKEYILQKYNFEALLSLFEKYKIDYSLFMYATLNKMYNIKKEDILKRLNQIIEIKSKELYKVCKTKNVQEINKLLNLQNVDINYSKNNETILELLYKKQLFDVVENIIQNPNSDFKFENKKTFNPLIAAYKSGQNNIVKLLLNNENFDSAYRNTNTYNMLFDLVCKNQDSEMLNILLNSDKISFKYCTNYNPLISLCKNKLYDKFNEILMDGNKYDLDYKDTITWNALLKLAIADKQENVIRLLLDNRRINFDFNGKNNPIFSEYKNNNLDIVKLLINSNKISLDLQTQDTSDTILSLACQNNDAEMVKFILSKNNANIDRTNKNKKTAFVIACENKNIELIKILINNGININNTKNKNALKTLFTDNKIELSNQEITNKATIFEKLSLIRERLLIACQNNDIGNVNLLINDKTIDINYSNDNNETALSIACKNKNIQIIKALIQNDKLDLNNIYNRDTLKELFNNENIIKDKNLIINEIENINKQFFNACERDDIETINNLIDNPLIDINYKNNESNSTFLSVICNKTENIELIKTLIDKRINFNNEINKIALNTLFNDFNIKIEKNELKNKKIILSKLSLIRERLLIACQNNNIGDVNLLINDKTIDINYSNDNNETALSIACKNKNIQIIKALVQNDKLDLNNVYNKDVLKKLFNNNENIIKDKNLIINEIENINKQFFNACKKDDIETINNLINNPLIDINYKNDNNSTFLSIACNKTGNIELIKTLIDKRINFNNEINKIALNTLFNDFNISNITSTTTKDTVLNKLNMLTADFIKEQLFHAVINKKKINTLKRILSRKSLNFIDDEILLIAVSLCLHKAIKLLIKDRRIVQNYVEENKISPLLGAVYNEDIKSLNILLNTGRVDVNTVNDKGETALAFACKENKKFNIIKYLITQHDIDLNANKDALKDFFTRNEENIDEENLTDKDILIRKIEHVEFIKEKREYNKLLPFNNAYKELISKYPQYRDEIDK